MGATLGTILQSTENSLRNRPVYLFIPFIMSRLEFFIACMMLSLEYLHSKSILHRDIKPENLVFDEEGTLIFVEIAVCRLYEDNGSGNCSSVEP
jgi:serine/threonine protein kinase